MAKLLAYYRLFLADVFVYRGAAFLWIFADGVTSLMLPLVWLAASSSGAPIGNMPMSAIVTYYVGSLTLSQFVTCHMMWDIAYYIREGVFSIYLVRPFSFFWAMFADNLAWRIAKLTLFTPVLVLMLAAYWGYLHSTPLHFRPEFFLAVALGHMVSFAGAFALGIIGLRTQESYAIIRFYYLPEMFLSGRLFPLALLPGWAATLANYTPFSSTISFPLRILLGQVEGSAMAVGLATQVGWLLAMCLIGRMLWRSGLKTYTGVGM